MNETKVPKHPRLRHPWHYLNQVILVMMKRVLATVVKKYPTVPLESTIIMAHAWRNNCHLILQTFSMKKMVLHTRLSEFITERGQGSLTIIQREAVASAAVSSDGSYSY